MKSPKRISALLRRAANLFLLASTHASASGVFDVEVNSTYLSNTKSVDPTPIIVLDPARQRQLRQQYEDINRDYELKERAGILTQVEKANHYSAMNSLSQTIVSDVQNYQTNLIRDRTWNILKKSPEIMAIVNAGKMPAAIAGSVLAIYNGTSYTVHVYNMSVTPGVSVKNRSASLGLGTKIINASISADTQTITAAVSRGITAHSSINYTSTCTQGFICSSTISISYGISL